VSPVVVEAYRNGKTLADFRSERAGPPRPPPPVGVAMSGIEKPPERVRNKRGDETWR